MRRTRMGGTFFALDGCKLPSNASKEWSGRISDLKNKQAKLEQKVLRLLKEQIEADHSQSVDPAEQSKRERQINELQHQADLLKPSCLRRKNAKCKTLDVPIGVTDDNYSNAMSKKVDSPKGRRIYPHRIAIVEPVFANIRTHKLLNRFTLRGKSKVNIQWMLYCMVHNLGKIMRYAPG